MRMSMFRKCLAVSVALFCALLTQSPGFAADVVNRTPRLDDIKVFYHGLALDGDGHVVTILPEHLPRLYQELAEQALNASRADSEVANAVRQSNVLAMSIPAADAQGTINAISQRDLVVDVLLRRAVDNPVAQLSIRQKLQVLRWNARKHSVLQTPSVGTDLRPYLDEYSSRMTSRGKVGYKSCEDPSIPVPPDYNDTSANGWSKTITVPANLTMLQEEEPGKTFFPDTQVLFHRSEQPKGLCALLKRFAVKFIDSKDPDEFELLGVICESEETGKTCFWQNNLYDSNGQKLLTAELEKPKNWSIAEKWASSVSGELSMDCVACHAGNNAFIFFKGTDLCYPDSGGDEAPCFGSDSGYATAVGPWKDETQKFSDAKQGIAKDNKCLRCHTLAGYFDPKSQTVSASQMCSLLAFVVNQKLMPPIKDVGPIHWNGAPQSTSPYQAAVDELRTFCINH